MNSVVLKMEGICKGFPGVKALQNVTFDLQAGEVHALMGENGAGKSTLMKCLGGIYPIDEGKIYLDGKETVISDVNDSLEKGISIIHQELVLNEQQTVADNIFMGREPQNKLGFIQRKEMYKKAQDLLDSIGASFSAYSVICTLSTAQKQLVEIAKALSMNARIIVMDEPTAVLTKKEVDKLFALIASLKSKGYSIVYISHRMEEIFTISDRITVLRDGMTVGSLNTKQTTVDKLIEMMVGRSFDEYFTRNRVEIGDVILEGKNLSRKDGKVKNASFNLRRGEILGFSGLVGAGRTELMRVLFGIDRASEGEILIDGKPAQIRNVRQAMKQGIGLVTEDRKLEGLFLDSTVKFNISIGVLDEFIKTIHVNKRKETDLATNYIHELNIKVSNELQKAVNLSGGNQQKVVLAKWLAIAPHILIMDEPTRGIDVGAKAEIYAIMDKLVQNGVSIIMVSSDMPELIYMCDRIYVMSNGKITACLGMEDINQQTILKYALEEH